MFRPRSLKFPARFAASDAGQTAHEIADRQFATRFPLSPAIPCGRARPAAVCYHVAISTTIERSGLNDTLARQSGLELTTL